MDSRSWHGPVVCVRRMFSTSIQPEFYPGGGGGGGGGGDGSRSLLGTAIECPKGWASNYVESICN